MVEDNEINIYVANIILERVQCVVTVARNGQEAIDIFSASRENSFDAILMDVRMPVMDGLTATFVQYLGKFLPSAVFGVLVIYCLKNVNLVQGSHGLPEFISILVTGGLHLWKRQMLLSIAGGTICYMLLIHFVF